MRPVGSPMCCSRPDCSRPRAAARQVAGWFAPALLAWMTTGGTEDLEPTLPARLPASVSPVRYELHLEPDAAALTFVGRETIDVLVRRETSRIVLNALDLAIHDARLDDSLPAEVATDAAAQTATLSFAKPVAPGPHRLQLAFSGQIVTSAAGLFALDYATASGSERMLTMQLEPMDGRRVAPMWDEPAAKAVFELEVVIPKDQSAYSNMPVASSRVEGKRQTIRFQPTPKMSSYLLHLTVGKLERVSRMVAGVDTGVVVRRGAGPLAAYALDASAQVLPWFNDYFGTPYPLPKLDMIAAPGQSSFFGAMENWGAIMYFERAILIDPDRAGQSDRQGVFDTIAHEVAHQWFGDLVTMQWWDDLWLNEGFASWMARRIASALHPDWKPWLQMVASSRELAMRLDAGSATHAIVQPVDSAEAASQAFDAIAYSKGEAVIRMIEDAVGEAGFRDGIRRYMKAHAYANTVTDDLWREIAAATGQPIAEIAHDFTRQPGVPLVMVGATSCVDGTTTVPLAQSRFETDGQTQNPAGWHIPVRLRVLEGGAEARVLLAPGTPQTVRLRGCGPVVVNAGQAGYFRTLYEPAALESLRRNFDRVAEIDRLGILSDAWSLGNAARLPASTYLDFAGKVPADSDPVVWSQVATNFVEIDQVFDESPEQANWRRLARAQLRPRFEDIGWVPRAGQGDSTALLRESLIAALGALDDPEVVTQARERLMRSATDPGALPPAIRASTLDVAARHADAPTWESMLDRARQETQPDEKQRLYVRLGAPLDPALAGRALELALSGEPPATSAPSIITRVGDRHPALAFDFAVAHEQQVLAMVEASSRWSYVAQLARGSADPALADRLRAYMLRSIPASGRQDAEQAIAEILRRARSHAYSRPELEAWVRARTGAGCQACRAHED